MRCTNQIDGSLPVAEHPVRRSQQQKRWQVSRLAEQDFSSDPRLPDLFGQWHFEDLSGHGRGGGCVSGSSSQSKALSPLAFPLRLS
jgi:hypothetical protein